MMMTKRNDILLAPGFLAGLLVLLANDFFFKYQFHNALTGKLSDIAGLFIFPLFIAAVTRSNSKHLFLAVALFFIYWKSPFSEGLLNAASAISGMTFTRVVDYTDLLCLPVLALSYQYLQKQHHNLHVSRSLILFLSSFAFIATSQKRSAYREENNLLREGYKIVVPVKTYLVDVNRLQSSAGSNDKLMNLRNYDDDTLHVFLKEDSANHSFVFVFKTLKDGNARLVRVLVYQDRVPDADQLYRFLDTEISKREWVLKKQEQYNAKMDSLIKLTLFYHHDKHKDDEQLLIDTVLKYATPELISEHQLYELKADILIGHYDSAYKKEILMLLDQQDVLDSSFNRSSYSVNRYGKRLDFYDVIRKDSMKYTGRKKANSPKQ